MYEAKDFSGILGTEGFSDDLLNNHFKLYQGYVNNTNKLIELFKELDPTSPQFAELKRRFGWEFNGMRLHELYFGNMSKDAKSLDRNTRLAMLIEDHFGSMENWEKDFRATGSMRGIGWAILCMDKATGKLFNVWINEHDLGHLAESVPLLVMDVFEHAFVIDYGMNRGEYIDSFMKAIDWSAVEKRLKTCGCGNGGGCSGGACKI